MPVPVIVGTVIVIGSLTGIALLVWEIASVSKHREVPKHKNSGTAPSRPTTPKPKTSLSAHPPEDIALNESSSPTGSSSRIRLIAISSEGEINPNASIADVAASLIDEPISEDNDSEHLLLDAPPLSPILEEPEHHQSSLVVVIVDETTKRGENWFGSVSQPLLELGSEPTEVSSSQLQEPETKEPASTSPNDVVSPFVLIDTTGAVEAEAPAFQPSSTLSPDVASPFVLIDTTGAVEAEAPAFQPASTLSPDVASPVVLIDTTGAVEAEAPALQDANNVDSQVDLSLNPPDGPLTNDSDGATKEGDIVLIPSASVVPELPVPSTETPPDLDPVQEVHEATSQTATAVEPEPVSDSPISEPILLPHNVDRDIVHDEEPQPFVVDPVTLPTTGTAADVINLKEDSGSIKSTKSDRSKVTGVGKKALKSFKGVFGSKAKAVAAFGSAGAKLRSPSSDTLASVESQGRRSSIHSTAETGTGSLASLKGRNGSRDSIASNSSKTSKLPVAKGGMKRLFGLKDKSSSDAKGSPSSSPVLEPYIPSSFVEGQVYSSTSSLLSDTTTLTPSSPPLPAGSGSGSKKKQRQPSIDNSPMLKGMFKGRNPLRKPTI